MARQIIDIGIQGNDGTGDSIRESFRKVNNNFSQLFAIFGAGDSIAFKDLADTPSNFPNGIPRNSLYSDADKVVVANETADALIAKSIVAGPYITVSHEDPNQISISGLPTTLLEDQKPTLAAPLNANGYGLGNIANPDDALAAYNTEFTTAQLEDSSSFAVNKGYSDRRYFRPAASSATTDLRVRIKSEPLTADGYTNTVTDWVNGNANIPSHGFSIDSNGIGVVYNKTGTTAATGVVDDGTVYYIRYVDADTVALYSTKESAISGDTIGLILVNSDPEVAQIDRGVETLTDAKWDSSLEGYWLADEAVPRTSIVRRQGDTMTGYLTLSADPDSDLHAATKQYVDTAMGTAQSYAESYYTAGADIEVTDGEIAVVSSTTATNDSIVKRTTVGGIEASKFSGMLVTSVQPLALTGLPETLTVAQITGNILTATLTADTDLILPLAAEVPGMILIIRNQSDTYSLTVNELGDPPTAIVVLTPAALTAQIASDGVSWFVL